MPHSSLYSGDTGVLSGKAGEVHPRWEGQVRRFQDRYDRETEPALRDYWTWRIEVARGALAAEQTRVIESSLHA